MELASGVGGQAESEVNERGHAQGLLWPLRDPQVHAFPKLTRPPLGALPPTAPPTLPTS